MSSEASHVAGRGGDMAPGMLVIVDGEVVAWFAKFDEDAHEWCSYNHFGRWLLWPAEQPEAVKLTAEQEAAAKKQAEELTAFFDTWEKD